MTFAGSAGAITGNYTKDFTHDAVGLLVFYTPNTPAGEDPFSHRCSGTLISPTVMVTAGHCTEGVDEGRVYFQQSVAPNYDPNAFGGWGGDPTTGYPYRTASPSTAPTTTASTTSRASRKPRTQASSFSTNPSRLRTASESCPRPARSIATSPRRRTRSWLGSPSVVTASPTRILVRCRSVSGSTATSYAVEGESTVTDANLKTTANASQGKGGTCNGDSGGPVYFYGTNIIAAVTSFGMNGQCKGLDFSYRLDRAAVLAWINDPNRVDAG